MAQETILSGIQPSGNGKLHIGNYFGALQHFVKLQYKHHCFFGIADYHSITTEYSPQEKQAQIMETAREFLAAGLDPKKCTLFIQSYIPEHMELAWILGSVTPVSFLERMTQFKDKSAQQRQNINAGLLTYPILQAADILIYRATAVPVGRDQEQHLELTREIARMFNNKFGNYFKEPKTLLTETPKIMSLVEPDKKMSKTLGGNHCIYLDDEPKIINKKISRATTDAGSGNSQGAQNLLALVKLFSTAEVYAQLSTDQKAGQLKYGELKSQLTKDIVHYFADFRKRKKMLSATKVKKVFEQGSSVAQKVAAKTMIDVRKNIGIR